MQLQRTLLTACLFVCGLFCWGVGPVRSDVIVDFQDLTLSGAETFYNGSDLAGGFSSGGATFNNTYDATFNTWNGWSYSNMTDVTTPGTLPGPPWVSDSQYSAYSNLPLGGGHGSTKYAMAFVDSLLSPPLALTDPLLPRVELPPGMRPVSVSITNNTYAALSMQGLDPNDLFSKKFGGPTGDDPDFFKLTITGLTSGDTVTGSVDFFLADFRDANNSNDYIVDDWTSVDLAALGEASKLVFTLDTSDFTDFGGGVIYANTPFYFGADNLRYSAVPEPGTLWLTAIAAAALAGARLWRGKQRNRRT